ncbi:MAG: hypothetical protein ACRD3B_07525 [Candidatus Sulfotelmatobacter sp.]
MAVLAVIAMAGVAPAHAQEGRMSVNVPFDFVLGKTTLRSGQYHVERQPSGVVVFTNLDSSMRRFAVLTPGGEAVKHSEPYLVFNRYGHDTFLSRVVFSVQDNYDLPKTDREKELIANVGSSLDLAVLIQPAQ